MQETPRRSYNPSTPLPPYTHHAPVPGLFLPLLFHASPKPCAACLPTRNQTMRGIPSFPAAPLPDSPIIPCVTNLIYPVQ